MNEKAEYDPIEWGCTESTVPFLTFDSRMGKIYFGLTVL